MSKDPLESWTHLLPVEAILDYLDEFGSSDVGREPRVCILSDLDPSVRLQDVPERVINRAERRKRYAQVRSVAGLTLILAGARLCVALALTRKDIDRAQEWGAYRVVSVRHHKTRRFHGAAHIVLHPHGLLALADLARATEEFYGEDEARHRNLFGLTVPHGRANPEIFSDFNAFVRERGYDPEFTAMRFNKARKAAESFSHLLGADDHGAQDGEAPAVRAVTDFLLHSKAVRNLYYRKTSYSSLVTRWTAYNNLFAVLYILEALRADHLLLPTHTGKSSTPFSYLPLPFFICPAFT